MKDKVSFAKTLKESLSELVSEIDDRFFEIDVENLKLISTL